MSLMFVRSTGLAWGGGGSGGVLCKIQKLVSHNSPTLQRPKNSSMPWWFYKINYNGVLYFFIFLLLKQYGIWERSSLSRIWLSICVQEGDSIPLNQ